MKVFELESDGELTRAIIKEIGDEFNLRERLGSKTFGLGQLKYKSGNLVLDEFYERHNNTIKTHFDWTTDGAAIRLRTMSKLYAIGLSDDEIKLVTLTKRPDYIYATPLFPFWILLKLRVPLKIAKWFRIRGDKWIEGPCILNIKLEDTKLDYELSGDMWDDCLRTFGVERVKERITVVDERTWITDNGIRVY
jgi:hypothetical protein